MPEEASARFLRLSISTILVGLGIYVLFEVLIRAKTLYDTPESFKTFLALVPEDVAVRTLTVDTQVIVLPLATMHFFAYGIALALLMIAGLIGGVFLKRGLSAL